MTKYISVILIFISSISFSQTDSTRKYWDYSDVYSSRSAQEIGLITGITQFSYTTIELGIARAKWKTGCIWGSYFHGLSLSADWRPYPEPENLGILLTAWHSGGPPLSWGININSYTDFDKANLGIKPMLGIGSQNIQIIYGYNFQLVNNDLRRINNHNVSLRVFIPLTELNKN